MKNHLLIIPLFCLFSLVAKAQSDSNIKITNNSVDITATNDVNISTANGKAYYNSKEIATKGEVGRCATIVIAASNASAKSKASADIVCTGTDDQYKIHEAVQNIASSGVGGKIQLTEGDYNFSDGVLLVALNNNKALSITVEGMGSATILHRRYSSTPGKAQGLFGFGLPPNPNTTNKYVTTIRNMKYNGHMDIYAQPPSNIQTFATSYTERTDVLETTVYENIICENVHNESHIFIAMGSHAIMRSLDLGNAHSSYGLNIVPSFNQQGNVLYAVVDNCISPCILLNAGNKTFITNNVVKSIHLQGENIICTGNIYNYLGNSTTNSMISNNLQTNMP